MKTTNDGFTPAFIYPIEVILEEFKGVCRQIEAIEITRDKLAIEYNQSKGIKKPNRTERCSHYKSLAAIRLRLSELYKKKERLKKELAERMRKTPVTFADDVPTPINECVGYCYGKCIYVDDEGDLRYREIEREGAEAIGEKTADIQDLNYIYELPSAEMKMIIEYLKESPDTPLWVKGYEE